MSSFSVTPNTFYSEKFGLHTFGCFSCFQIYDKRNGNQIKCNKEGKCRAQCNSQCQFFRFLCWTTRTWKKNKLSVKLEIKTSRAHQIFASVKSSPNSTFKIDDSFARIIKIRSNQKSKPRIRSNKKTQGRKQQKINNTITLFFRS